MDEAVMDLKQQLECPFPASAVSWRVGRTSADKSKGMVLAYIDARDVMRRLDDVVGLTGWQDEYTETQTGRLLCRLSLNVLNASGELVWVTKSDGAGQTDVEGEKGAISDAFKRAAVKWGIGRYLYSMPSPWVDLDEHKRIVKDPILPDWATPEGYAKLIAKRSEK